MAGVPVELTQPFTGWLEELGISVLRPIFELPVTTYGYGSLDQIPAAYVLKYMSLANWRMLFGRICRTFMLKPFLAFAKPFLTVSAIVVGVYIYIYVCVCYICVLYICVIYMCVCIYILRDCAAMEHVSEVIAHEVGWM